MEDKTDTKEETTKSIPLTQGRIAIVDADDFEYLNQWKWCANRNRQTFYAVRSVYEEGKQRQILMHRLLLNSPEGLDVDHVDQDGLNNIRSNIRLCTTAENQHNGRKRQGTSRYKGVYWNKRGPTWVASIRVNRLLLHLGSFPTEADAAIAYNWAANRYFGGFARLNLIEGE